MEICEVACSEQYKSKPIAVFSKVPIYVITANIDTSKSFFSYTSLFKQSWSVAMRNLKRVPCLFSSVLQKWSQNICCKKCDGGCRKFGNFEPVLCYMLQAALVLCFIGRKQKKREKNLCLVLLVTRKHKTKKKCLFFLVSSKRKKNKLNVWCFLLVEENKKQIKKTQMKCLVFLVSRKK